MKEKFRIITEEYLNSFMENEFIELDKLDFLIGQSARLKLVNDELNGKILKIDIRLKEL